MRQNSRKQEDKMKILKIKTCAKYYVANMTIYTRKSKKKLGKDSNKDELLCYSFTHWIHVKS